MPLPWRKMFAWTGAARMTAPAPAASFALEIPPEMLEAMTSNDAIARPVSRAEALQVPAVLRARNLICSTGTLPVRVHEPSRKVSTAPWLVPQPDPEIPSSVVMAQTIEDLLFEGIAWWRVMAFGPRNFPLEARHVPVNAVHIVPNRALRPSEMLISPDQPFPVDGAVYIDGVEVPDREIIRFDSPNPPLLQHAARAIRTCLLLDKAAALYSKDPLPLGYFSPEEGSDPIDDDEIEELLTKWETSRAKRAWGYLKSLKANTLQWNPEQLQLAAQRQHAVLEIARATGLDPEDLSVSTTSRTYQNLIERKQERIDTTQGPYVSAIQDRLSMRDIVPRGFVTRIDFAGFLRGDTKTRMETYEIGLRVGAYADEDEVRELEDRPPLTPAQRAARAKTQQPATIPGKAPTMAESIPADKFVHSDLRGQLALEAERRETLERDLAALTDRVARLTAPGARRELERVNFTTATDDVVRVSFTSDEVAATFRVNAEKRTISGLVIPWGKIARSGFSKWKFAEGSLHWSSEARVKLNLNHNFDQAIGVGVRLQSTSQGLDGTYKIARGEEGDRALSLAEDGVLDGFSAEVYFDDEAGDEWQPDPSDESVRLVRRGTLRGTALTGFPAFDDARVTSVKASRDRSGTVPPTATTTPASGQATTPDADGFTTFMSTLADKIAESQQKATEGLSEKIGEMLSEGVKAALENIHDPQADGPQPVRAARWTVTREAPVYTLNGAGPSLVRDAWHAQMSRDDDAMERIRKFRKQTEDMAKVAHDALHFQVRDHILGFTTSTTANAASVIPPGYRPDLFVPQLAQGRPFVNNVSQGVIANATPFVVPVFGSATGATADHVEGVNPTDGTLTFTTKTVTPGAISGLLKLTREIVDSSNPAIDQIALFAMRESYARQTEAKVYTLLNGASGQGGVITAGFVPSGAQVSAVTGAAGGFAPAGVSLLDAVRAAMAVYPFRRFAAPDVSLMSQEATSSFAAAKDTTGRQLLPSVGATNAAGIGNALTQGWFVDGLAHIPAWAISGNAAGDADTFMFNRADVWAWESPILTFRYEERSGPAVIDLALFGYFATHLLRPVGLSSVRLTVTP